MNINDRLRGYNYEFVCNCWIPDDNNVNYKSFSNTGTRTYLSVMHIVSPSSDRSILWANIITAGDEVATLLLGRCRVDCKLVRGSYHRVQLSCCPEPLLPTWINFNPSMEKNLHPLQNVRWNYYIHYKVWAEIIHPFPNFNGCTVEVWEWINNFSPYFTGHVITYPCWDWS